MGGCVTVIIREPKQVHKMCRWTNTLGAFLKHPKLLQKDPTFLQSYLRAWQEMNADYQQNKADGKFEHNMTDIYIPQSGVVAPVEYGLVLVDYVDNRILSYQDFTQLDRINLGSIEASLDNSDDDTLAVVQEFLNTKIINQVIKGPNQTLTNAGAANLLTSGDIARDLMEFKRTLKLENPDETLWNYYFQFDFAPFQFMNYFDQPAGLTQLYQEIKKLFPLSAAEEQQWQAFINENQK